MPGEVTGEMVGWALAETVEVVEAARWDRANQGVSDRLHRALVAWEAAVDKAATDHPEDS